LDTKEKEKEKKEKKKEREGTEKRPVNNDRRSSLALISAPDQVAFGAK